MPHGAPSKSSFPRSRAFLRLPLWSSALSVPLLLPNSSQTSRISFLRMGLFVSSYLICILLTLGPAYPSSVLNSLNLTCHFSVGSSAGSSTFQCLFRYMPIIWNWDKGSGGFICSLYRSVWFSCFLFFFF